MELEIEEEPVVKEAATLNPSSGVTEGTPANKQFDEDSTTPNPTVSQPGLRRSTRNKRKPDRYSPSLTLLSTEQQDPSSVAEAKSSPEKGHGNGNRINEVWEIVEPPPNQRVVGFIDADGVVKCYKARLVAQGCSQKFGLDYEKTFESIRSVVALGTQPSLQLHRYSPHSSMEKLPKRYI